MVLKKAPENIRLSKELQGTKDQLLQVRPGVRPRRPGCQATQLALRKLGQEKQCANGSSQGCFQPINERRFCREADRSESATDK
jgi:hypothetical protein